MATAKQEAEKRVKELHQADPTLKVEELCAQHGVSPSYYYNVDRMKAKAAKKSKAKVKTAIVSRVPPELATPFTVPATSHTAQGFSKAMVIVVPTNELASLLRETFA
jgi:hypothetical protein